jgi:cell division protein FtsX
MENDPYLIPIAVLYGLLAVYFVWLFLTPKGKSFRAKNKEKALDKAKRVSDGTYRTDKKAKIAAFLSGVVIITSFTFFIGVVFLAELDPYFWEGQELTFVVVGLIGGAFFSALALGIANMAEQKGRSFDAFFMLSVIFSPIIMGIIAASLGPVAKGQSSTQSAPSVPDITEQIKKLSDLREQGILTQEEFDDKKEQLLKRI